MRLIERRLIRDRRLQHHRAGITRRRNCLDQRRPRQFAVPGQQMAMRAIAGLPIADVDVDDPALHRRQHHEWVGLGLERLERVEDVPDRAGMWHLLDRAIQSQHVPYRRDDAPRDVLDTEHHACLGRELSQPRRDGDEPVP